MNHRHSSVSNVDGGLLSFDQVDDRGIPSVRVTVSFKHPDSGVDQKLSIVVTEQELHDLAMDTVVCEKCGHDLGGDDQQERLL